MRKASYGKAIGEAEVTEDDYAYSRDEFGYFTYGDSELEEEMRNYGQGGAEGDDDFEVDDEEFRKYEEKFG